MDVSKLINYGDFVVFKKDIGDEEYSVSKGTKGYVAGVTAVPEKENDPYTQRVKFFVNIVDSDGHLLPDKFFVVDPKSVKKMKEKDQELLTAQLQLDFGEEGEGATVN